MFVKFIGGTLRRFNRNDKGTVITNIERKPDGWIVINTENGRGLGFHEHNIDITENTEVSLVLRIMGEYTRWHLSKSVPTVENQSPSAQAEQSASTPDK
jgi:hypothetical protein